MAGFYPDVPGPRMAYHLDGTEIYRTNQAYTNIPTQLTPTQVASVNKERDANLSFGASPGFIVIFPELRDISGIHVANTWTSGPTLGPLQVSSDTTNGVDGTWTTAATPTPGQVGNLNIPLLRTGIGALALNGVKALRFWLGQSAGQARLGILHIYGRISNMQLDRRLRLWHPTLDEPISGHHFDFGDVARGSSGTIDFRVKNHSTEWQATDVTVGITHPTDATPTMADQLLLSTASSPTPEGQKAIGTLAPEAISETITLHRNTSSTAQLSLWWSLIVAEASHWDDPDAEPEP